MIKNMIRNYLKKNETKKCCSKLVSRKIGRNRFAKDAFQSMNFDYLVDLSKSELFVGLEQTNSDLQGLRSTHSGGGRGAGGRYVYT